MVVGHTVIFDYTDCTPGCLVVLHVERVVFCLVIPMLLINVAKKICLHESNVLSAVFLLMVVFGVAGHQAFGAPDILILEV